MQFTSVQYGISVLFFSGCVTSLIVPEELPTILSLIYSNIPPIKKGTDSRLGVGFRLGEHADFQVLVELGPQRETDPIGITETKRRREATLSAAMNGEMGPWAQSIAKYQMQLRIEKELEAQSRLQEKLKKSQIKEIEKSEADQWLTKWGKGMVEPPGEELQAEDTPIRGLLPNMIAANRISTNIKRSPAQSLGNNDMSNKVKELQKLYKPQPAVVA